MSMVFRAPDGQHVLLIKGADNVIMDRAAAGLHNDTLVHHLVDFAKLGLRTLVLAQRYLPPHEVERWLVEYKVCAALVLTVPICYHLNFTHRNYCAVNVNYGVVYVCMCVFICGFILLRQRAANSIVDRATKLSAVAELIEKDLDVLGATAIEDKLQVRMLTTAALKMNMMMCCPAVACSMMHSDDMKCHHGIVVSRKCWLQHVMFDQLKFTFPVTFCVL